MSSDKPETSSRIALDNPWPRADDAPIDREAWPAGASLLCDHCACPLDATAVRLEASALADRLWTLSVCGPCWEMLLAAIAEELAGGGPGGHREVHPPGHAPAAGTTSGPAVPNDAAGAAAR